MVKEKRKRPSIDEWLREAKKDVASLEEGMYLLHNGIVRQSPKKKVRQGIDDGSQVKGMFFSYDQKKVAKAVEETKKMPGIFHVRTWLNEGDLEIGDDIMFILIGGDIRPHVIDGLQFLVEKIKNKCVTEIEKK